MAIPNALPNQESSKTTARRILDAAGIASILEQGRPEKGKTWTIFDSEIPSYNVRVSPTGAVMAGLLYSKGGKMRRFKIGRIRTADMAAKGGAGDRGITASEARRKADAWRARIVDGEDPAADKIAKKLEARDSDARAKSERAKRVTVETALEQYLDALESLPQSSEARPRESTLASMRKSFRLHVYPVIGKQIIGDLTKNDVLLVHTKASQRRNLKSADGRTRPLGGDIAANRAFDYLRGALSWAVAEGKADTNVAKLVTRFRNTETKRKRYLSPDEWSRLEDVLDEWPLVRFEAQGKPVPGRAFKEVIGDEPDPARFMGCEAIRFILLTGCRKGEALAARWSDVDFENRIWTKPASTTKQKKDHHLPLSQGAIDVLKAIRAAHDDSEWVFPDPERLRMMRLGRPPKADQGSHVGSIDNLWRSVRKRAGLGDVRIHDLRHSFASLLINNGVSLQVVGTTLGHSDNRSTERYAHIAKDAQRKALEIVDNSRSKRVR